MMPWPTNCSRLEDSGTEIAGSVKTYKSCKIELFWVCCHEDVFYWAGFGTENKEGNRSLKL